MNEYNEHDESLEPDLCPALGEALMHCEFADGRLYSRIREVSDQGDAFLSWAKDYYGLSDELVALALGSRS